MIDLIRFCWHARRAAHGRRSALVLTVMVRWMAVVWPHALRRSKPEGVGLRAEPRMLWCFEDRPPTSFGLRERKEKFHQIGQHHRRRRNSGRLRGPSLSYCVHQVDRGVRPSTRPGVLREGTGFAAR